MKQGLEDLEIYRDAMRVADEIWDRVIDWERLFQRTVGKQRIRAVDSIAANFAEGCGRYHSEDNPRFCCIAGGSLNETRTWLRKATRRRPIDKGVSARISEDLDVLPKRLNAYIGSLSRAVIS